MFKKVNLLSILLIISCDFRALCERISEKICRETYSDVTNPPTSQNNENQKKFEFGKVSTVPGEFPYMVALGWKNEKNDYNFYCGGVLIWPQYILTAAHCMKDKQHEAPQFVRIGGGNLLDMTIENIPILAIYEHPDFNRKSNHYNDIAILKIASPSTYPPACLWQTPEINQTDICTIGYGEANSNREYPKDLLKVYMKILSNDLCQTYYKPVRTLKDGIIDSQLCIADIDKDTCSGDGGGPALIKIKDNGKVIPYVAGIVSFGRKCGDAQPTVTTRISSYIDWIESVVSK